MTLEETLFALEGENRSLLTGMIAILKTIGGTVEVSDETVASVDLRLDRILVSQARKANSHTISLKPRD